MCADNNLTPVYLVMATGAPESQISIRYAVQLAQQNNAQLAACCTSCRQMMCFSCRGNR